MSSINNANMYKSVCVWRRRRRRKGKRRPGKQQLGRRVVKITIAIVCQETEVEYDGGCDQDTKERERCVGVCVFTWSWSAVCDLSMNIFVCLSAFNNTGQFLSRPV